MRTHLTRTTVQIEAELIKRVKHWIVEHDMTFREAVELGLTMILTEKAQEKPKTKKKVRFGGRNLGGFKGNLGRDEIYEEIEDGVI